MLDKQRILVIDDDKFIQKVLVKSLRDDYDTEVASSGEQGIALAQRYKPHVILLDVEMPGQNGYEVCDSLKHEAVTCDIPVVFLSSHSSLRERMLGYEVGGQDYLVKPFELEELRAKLGKITGAQAENLSLRSSAASAQNTAMEAMTSSF
jgi:DNA-binding response OmpR family regulator